MDLYAICFLYNLVHSFCATYNTLSYASTSGKMGALPGGRFNSVITGAKFIDVKTSIPDDFCRSWLVL
jgi:hypothetical protein